MAQAETGDARRAWDALFDALLGEHEMLSRRVRETLQAELPVYRSLPREELEADVRLEVERVIRSARAGRTAVSDRELADLAEVGERRARQGVALDDMLRAWRIGVQVLVSYAREVGRRIGIDDDQVLEFVESTLAWADVAMVTTAGGHRQAELDLALADQERRAAFVRGALFGALPPAELRVQAEAYSLDPTREYVAVRARAPEGGETRQLERALGFHDAAQHRRGLSAVIDGDVAGFLREPPLGDVEGVVGVGPPRPLERLTESYRLATRALVAAHASGLEGIHDVASLGLRAAVAADADVGDALRARYLDPLAEGSSAAELMATVRTYLANEMHVERTAEQLFVHQNTVRYRLARFEELTGASLRDPQVAFEVWWALERAAMRL
jgi:hypothetical protein